MYLLFDLSKEHPILPTQEIMATIESYQIPYTIIDTDDNVFILKIESKTALLSHLSSRLAFTHSISAFLFSASNREEMRTLAQAHPLRKQGTIAIRYRNRSYHYDSQEIIKNLAAIYTKDSPVDLEKPDHEILVIISDEKIVVGRLITTINRKQYEERKVQFRPFFSPISLHPKIARSFINCAHVSDGSSVLDPFCGTGGFLIEAGLLGCKLYGCDVQSEMIDGTKENLASYDITPQNIFVSDIGGVPKIIDTKIDAVVTDAPYGKSTTTKQESLHSLYLRAFESISKVLRYQGYIIIGLPDKHYVESFKHYFHLNTIVRIPVHRSLTRFFYIGVKKEP